MRGVQTHLMPLIREWAGNVLLNVHPSGSFLKGTAILSGTDIDLFISISESCTDTLKDVYEKLFRRLSGKGYSPKK
jgi:tRNA nucleotidyltransferase (CCA-adding enzyme)